MSGRPPKQHHQHHDPQRPSSSRAASSLSVAATPSVETSNPSEQDLRSATPLTQSPAQPFFRVPQPPRSATGESQSKAAKVAIPRLNRPADATGEGSTRSGGRHRVNHACEPCRHRKTKCSGERPVCRHCQDFKIVCFYADGKRDRVKKQFGSMAEKLADYERLLKDLLSKVPEDEAKLIKASLDRASHPETEESLTDVGTAPSIEVYAELEESGAESEASAGRAGSTGALDRTDEDFTREGAKATGFMGKNSDVTWLQRVRQENRYGSTPPSDADEETQRMHNISTSSLQSTRKPGDYSVPLPEAADGFTIHDSSYHLDDLAISTFDTVDPWEMPPHDVAQTLFDTYMHRVHPTFPIVGQLNLSGQFQKFIANPTQKPPDKWLAIVNLMFAISAKYSHLVQAEWKGDERDHLIYFSRARLLAINTDTLFAHPDLQMIQVMGLISFYLMCTSQINRAWTHVGIAVRHAVALGLNLRNDSTNLKDSLKEIRYRLWWALYTLEHRLCSITGRANCILDDHYTTPLPVPLDEDKFDTDEGQRLLGKASQQGDRVPSSNSLSPSGASSAASHGRSRSSGKSEQSRSPSSLVVSSADLHWAKDVPSCSSLYFLHFVQLSRLTQNVFHNLYNPALVDRPWSFIQSQMSQLNDQLESWHRRLPSTLDFRRKQRDRDFYEYRLNLGFTYYGTKMMVNRPCLCRLDRKLPGQSSKSREFNHSSALACVAAAQDMLDLIPNEPNSVGLIRVGPWWTVLPYLVQSATVLMLEISFRAHHMPQDADSLLESSKKVIRWLHALGEENLSAKRAWSLCNSMLHGAVTRVGRDVHDLPSQPPGGSSISSSSGGGGTVMSGISNTQGQEFSQLHVNMMNTSNYGNVSSMSAFSTYPGYDNMMQFDQYFPMPDGMHGSGSGLSHSQYPPADPSDAEVEFMTNAYHDDHGE